VSPSEKVKKQRRAQRRHQIEQRQAEAIERGRAQASAESTSAAGSDAADESGVGDEFGPIVEGPALVSVAPNRTVDEDDEDEFGLTRVKGGIITWIIALAVLVILVVAIAYVVRP
jgi:hypothetical protein